ncbi:MAG: AlpA family phage regulatory protein [Gammaproteobacteria bacterium]|nr:AlpA family phage regulatory protein [Gammaproteobacteria bacterium]
MSRTARFELARRGEFPKKIKLSKRASGWRYSDLMDWIISRPVT